MSEWKPIASAPKDGTVVDLWCIGDREGIPFYCPSYKRVSGTDQLQGRVTDAHWREDAWRPLAGLRLHSITVTPTHWMLIPSPPEGAE